MNICPSPLMAGPAAVEDAYRRIELTDNPVFIHLISKDEVIGRVRQAQGRFAGLLFAVKDNIDVAGLPTTAACPEFSYVAQRTAPCVQRLLDAGGVLIGKTNMDQFATGLVGTRSPYGVCRNAFHEEYISGGSSSGSALAVALGMADFALGTDTAGSGRVPAAFNAVVGLKPTPGAVSTAGVIPACRSLDCVSVFARTCAQALSVFTAIREEVTSASFPVDRFRVAVPGDLEFHGDTEYARLFANAVERLRHLGGEIRQINFAPFLEVQRLLYGPWVAERTADLEPFLPAMLPVTRKTIEAGRQFSAVDLFNAQHRLAELKKSCRGDWDVLCVPGAPTVYRISQVEADPIETNARLGRYTNFVNLLGLAAITLPAGFRGDGLPFGVTLVGAPFSEAALARLGARFTGEPEAIEPETRLKLAVAGAHLSGMPLNRELLSRGATLVRSTRTAPRYRLYAFDNKPGLVRTGKGASIEVEVWEMDARNFGEFVARIPPPLGIGTIDLADGEQVKGFLSEAYAVHGVQDITSFGGWRAYVESKNRNSRR